jgi:uncharacterized protein (TIGR03437 family)
MVVTNAIGSSDGEPVTIALAQPAVFLETSVSATQGAIVNGNLADPQHPAKRGDHVSIYCEGLGAVNPAITAGTLAPLDRLVETLSSVTVTIGGVSAMVEFAGLAPGTVGEYQVNVIVPPSAPPGSQVPVVVKAAGRVSPTVTMAVN